MSITVNPITLQGTQSSSCTGRIFKINKTKDKGISTTLHLPMYQRFSLKKSVTLAVISSGDVITKHSVKVGVCVSGRLLTSLDSLITSLTSLYPTKGRNISKRDVKEYKQLTRRFFCVQDNELRQKYIISAFQCGVIEKGYELLPSSCCLQEVPQHTECSKHQEEEVMFHGLA